MFGYYYRFSGGNTVLRDNVNPSNDPALCWANDGDFEFASDASTYYVEIRMHKDTLPLQWEFEEVHLNAHPPLDVSLASTRQCVRIYDQTSGGYLPAAMRSGQIGMVLKWPANSPGNPTPNDDVYIYVDPDWDNRH